MEIKIIQLHKKAAATFENIEDKVHLNADNRSVAIADGATQGYQSGAWADLLAGEFILNPVFNKEQFCNTTLQHCLTRFTSHSYSIPAPVNKALAMLDGSKRKEGASATFLGIRISGNGACSIIACGDCLLVRHTPGTQPDYVFPFSDLASLNANTAFISSRLLTENKFDPRTLHTEELFVDDRDELYLLTDALARLAFKDPSVLTQWDSFTDFQQLLDFATTNWENARLDNDDLTYVRISRVREPEIQVQKIVPYTGFSFKSPQPPDCQPSNVQPLPPQPPTPQPPAPKFPSPQPPDLGPIRAELGDLKNYVLNTGTTSRSKNQQRFLFTAILAGIIVFIQAFVLISGGHTRSRLNDLEDRWTRTNHDLRLLSDSVQSLQRPRMREKGKASTATLDMQPITVPQIPLVQPTVHPNTQGNPFPTNTSNRPARTLSTHAPSTHISPNSPAKPQPAAPLQNAAPTPAQPDSPIIIQPSFN